jgi:TolA-binding protein
LETAELAFAEFRVFNKDHERQADATFWLGRVQFMRGEYEKAAMTFSEFNSTYPNDARLVDTTMWIAESVSHFAPAEQACEIYASLPKLLDTPPETFMTQLAALSDAAKCKS